MIDLTTMTPQEYASQLKRTDTDCTVKIELIKLYGRCKPRFLGDPALEGRETYRPRKPATTKCPACGSHEFRTHNLVRVCSYCRCAA